MFILLYHTQTYTCFCLCSLQGSVLFAVLDDTTAGFSARCMSLPLLLLMWLLRCLVLRRCERWVVFGRWILRVFIRGISREVSANQISRLNIVHFLLFCQTGAGRGSLLKVHLLGPCGRGCRGDIAVHARRTLRAEADPAVPAES